MANRREPTVGFNRRPAAKDVKPRRKQTVWYDIGLLGLKIGLLLAIATVLFSFVYGFHYHAEPGMNPAVKDGDLVIYYRLGKDYEAGDLALVTFRGQTQIRRVVATGGDTVDFAEGGLMINGSFQQEREISEFTELFSDGPDFPITLRANEVFVLGDSRENAVDSRLYGPVNREDTSGKVITILRRRNL